MVLRHEGENDNQLKKRIRALSKVVEKVIPEIEVDGLTNKMGNIRKTVHQYDKIFNGEFGQVREHVVLEATWLGNFEPFSEVAVSSYIYDMLIEEGRDELIAQFNMAPFIVQVLSKFRTFCEKIMSLVRFSRSQDPIADLRKKIRHIYDIHQMLQDDEISKFLGSRDFDEMLEKVCRDDMVGYKNNNEWIPEHPATALIFTKPHDTWAQLKTEYNGNFKDLVIGDLPPESALVQTLIKVANRPNQIDWDVR